MFLFSRSTLAFYPESEIEAYEAAGTLPNDVIEVSDEVRNEYNFTPPEGKKLGVNSKGYPAWTDIPPPTPEELIANAETMRLSLKAIADSEIAWRQDSVDADIATEEEAATLAEWKKYRVLLMRVDTTKPVWPPHPTGQAS